MTQVGVSEFRQNLPSYLDRVLAGEEFEVLRNRMSIAKLIPSKAKARTKRIVRKILPEAFGMWKDRKEWKGMSTNQIADKLRQEAWRGKHDD